MIVGVADTHALIWYLGRDKRLSAAAKAFIDQAGDQGDEIGVSPMTLAETLYLVEKGRIPPETLPRMVGELIDLRSVFVEVAFDLHVAQAMARIPWAEVPDMPDRIIAATALYAGVPVISRDSKIQLSSIETVW